MLDYDSVDGLKGIVETSIVGGESLNSKLPREVQDLRGFSTPKIRRTLNRLCSYGPCRYLEIGAWAGSTYIPAVYGNDVEATVIDNWSQFVPSELPDKFDAKAEFRRLLELYTLDTFQTEVYDGDCFEPQLVRAAVRPFNIFFYDGNHDEPSTRNAIEIYGSKCRDPFVLVVDDWELTPTVEAGTRKALEQFTVHQTWVRSKALGGYHEGLFLAVLSPK